jgi:methionine synthase II (cobalamin-independent)
MPPPPHRAEHIGSLLRPQHLLNARKAVAEDGNEHNRTNLAAIEKKAIAEVVAAQVKRGITPITSGEFERETFTEAFFEDVEGLEWRFMELEAFRPDFPTTRPLVKRGLAGRTMRIATSKMKLGKSRALETWLYVRELLPEDRWKDVKIPLPPPGWWHLQLRDGNAYLPGVYGSDEEYLKDMTDALREEVLGLYRAGM